MLGERARPVRCCRSVVKQRLPTETQRGEDRLEAHDKHINDSISGPRERRPSVLEAIQGIARRYSQGLAPAPDQGIRTNSIPQATRTRTGFRTKLKPQGTQGVPVARVPIQDAVPFTKAAARNGLKSSLSPFPNSENEPQAMRGFSFSLEAAALPT